MGNIWIKVWQEKILSSMNLRQCNFTAHSLFLEYLIRVRPDGAYIGKLCYPTGESITDQELWNDMKMKARDYRTAKDRLLELGIITIDKKGCILLRKFSDLQSAIPQPKLGQSRAKVGTIPVLALHYRTEQNRTEQKRTEENRREPIASGDKSPSAKADIDNKFNELWSKYPNKDGKEAAKRHFRATVKTDQDWQDIQKALNVYLATERVKAGFIKNGSTWFNNWQDWVNFVETDKSQLRQIPCPRCIKDGVSTGKIWYAGYEAYGECPRCKGALVAWPVEGE